MKVEGPQAGRATDGGAGLAEPLSLPVSPAPRIQLNPPGLRPVGTAGSPFIHLRRFGAAIGN